VHVAGGFLSSPIYKGLCSQSQTYQLPNPSEGIIFSVDQHNFRGNLWSEGKCFTGLWGWSPLQPVSTEELVIVRKRVIDSTNATELLCLAH